MAQRSPLRNLRHRAGRQADWAGGLRPRSSRSLWHAGCVLSALVLWVARSDALAQAPLPAAPAVPPATVPPATVSPAAVVAADGRAAEPALPRVRFPEQDWHPDDDAGLPPPPGWVAAEFASLAATLGSSPESEPLDPGDVLTLETGRLASHRNGFFQKFSVTGAWLSGSGQDKLGIVETRSFVTVAVPLPTRDFPLLITPGFDVTSLDGPAWPDLPPQLYDAYLDLMWLPKLSDRWLGILSVAPGVYSDFDATQDDAIRIKGKGLVRYEWVPGRVQLLAGVLYLHRFSVNLLPAGGIVWDPDDDWHLELVFPRPQVAYRLTASTLHEDWFYVAGEFGGDTYSIRRGPDEWDMLELLDWRIFAGLERKAPGGGSLRFEAGYVFGRDIQFASGQGDRRLTDTVLIRAGFDY